MLEQERGLGLTELSNMPHHYVEIGSMLLAEASDDVDDCDEVRTLLEDIYDYRSGKLRESMKVLADVWRTKESAPPAATLSASAMEIACLKPSLLEAFNQVCSLSFILFYLFDMPTLISFASLLVPKIEIARILEYACKRGG